MNRLKVANLVVDLWVDLWVKFKQIVFDCKSAGLTVGLESHILPVDLYSKRKQ